MQSNLVTKKPKNPKRKVRIKVKRRIKIKTSLVYLVKKTEKKPKPIMKAKKRRMELRRFFRIQRSKSQKPRQPQLDMSIRPNLMIHSLISILT